MRLGEVLKSRLLRDWSFGFGRRLYLYILYKVDSTTYALDIVRDPSLEHYYFTTFSTLELCLFLSIGYKEIIQVRIIKDFFLHEFTVLHLPQRNWVQFYGIRFTALH